MPVVLVLQLKRFDYSPTRRGRVNTPIVFPHEGLDLARYAAPASRAQDECSIYDLAAVISHVGELGGGHYVAFARSCVDGTWRLFDDSVVRRVALED